MKRVITVLVITVAVFLQSGCNEPAQTAQYSEGRYAGKPDTPNWQSEQFDNSHEVWQKQVNRRTKLQSEYNRPGGV